MVAALPMHLRQQLLAEGFAPQAPATKAPFESFLFVGGPAEFQPLLNSSRPAALSLGMTDPFSPTFLPKNSPLDGGSALVS